jgi:hypothetical protein
MKNLFKLGLVVFGFALATTAVSDVAKAREIASGVVVMVVVNVVLLQEVQN